MARARWLWVWIGILAWAAPSARASTDGIGWLTEFGRALERSRETRAPIMVDVWAVWCAPCKVMDETTYRDPAVVEASRRLIPLKMDADVHGDFLEQRYRIDAYPTLLFVDHSGREITRLEGRTRTRTLLRTMQLVEAGYEVFLAGTTRQASVDQLEQASTYLAAVGNPAAAADLLRQAIRVADLDAGEEPRQLLELGLAEAQLAADEPKPAGKTFARLAAGGASPAVRARALAGLARSLEARGRADEALQTVERLRAQYPDEAAALAPME